MVRPLTYERQRLGRAAPDAATALRDVLAVYSSHPSAPLALSARARSMSAAGFRALDAVRVHAMRGSVHLMPPDAAARAFAALPESAADRANRLKRFGLGEERYAELRAALLAAAAEPRTQAELAAAVRATPEQTKGATAAMARAGELLRIGAPGLRSNALRYVAAPVPEHERDAALAWLVGEYLRTLGPATEADVVWWCGVTKGRARAALAAHELVELDDGLLLRAEDQADHARAAPPRGVDLLGKWDPLTMGHAPGARPGFAAECYDPRGDGLPVLLADGIAVGTWSLTAKEGFAATWFEPPGAKLRAAVEARAAELAALLS